MGDLFLSGYKIIGKVVCSQGGHRLTNELLRKVFMNNENFEQITIKEVAINIITNFLIEGLVVQIEFFENEALNVSLPEKLSCVVKETEPTIKGQTAANSSKPAILDNGLRIMVPQFIAEGESIIVSTETSEYLERS